MLCLNAAASLVSSAGTGQGRLLCQWLCSINKGWRHGAQGNCLRWWLQGVRDLHNGQALCCWERVTKHAYTLAAKQGNISLRSNNWWGCGTQQLT
jgi:hypothetical protein